MDLAGLIPTFGNFAWTIAFFVLALLIIVAVHEYGHYIVGRWTGIKSDVFSLGFGPVLYSRLDRHGTKWQIAALPFGGFVKFRGDANAASGKDVTAMSGLSEEERRSTMHGAPLWARTLTVAAGPVFNFALSLLVFALLLMARGVASDPITVEKLRPVPSVAQELQPGDVLLKIDGKDVPAIDEFAEFGLSLDAKMSIEYTVRRDNDEITVEGPWLYPALATSVSPGSAAEQAGLLVTTSPSRSPACSAADPGETDVARAG
ncbi:MAG: site-2 protease family protein [Boseongicola sp.]